MSKTNVKWVRNVPYAYTNLNQNTLDSWLIFVVLSV